MKEGRETGLDTREFTSNLLQKVFNLPDKPKIDMAHRVRRAQLRSGDPLRQIIVKLHNISVLEDIMKRIPQGTTEI